MSFAHDISNKIFLTALPKGHPRLKILFVTCSTGKIFKLKICYCFMGHPNKEIMQKIIDIAKEKGVVSAIIVRDDEIISIGLNTVNKDTNPTSHAEINAIEKAAKKLGTHKLKDCWIYSTFEPCPMCASACVWAKMKGIVYGANMGDINENYTQRVLIRCEDVIDNGHPKLKLYKDFMREECLEVMK